MKQGISTSTSYSVISRMDAYRLGQRKYFTGVPCRKGHISYRYVANGICVECQGTRYDFRQNPWTVEFEPYACPKLWTARNLDLVQRARLWRYLQICIYHFLRDKGLMTPGMEEAAAAQQAHGSWNIDPERPV